MKKETIEQIFFSPCPEVSVRVIEFGDSSALIERKKKFPFILENSVSVVVQTSERSFDFVIHNGYCWNGADIPRFLWRLIGARTDNDFLLASMVHDFMLEFKHKIMAENFFKSSLTMNEYRRLTSLIFREIIKNNGTNTIKANIMSFAVDVFQKYFNKKGWKEEK